MHHIYSLVGSKSISYQRNYKNIPFQCFNNLIIVQIAFVYSNQWTYNVTYFLSICDNFSRKGIEWGPSAQDNNHIVIYKINEISPITNEKLTCRLEYRLNTRAFEVAWRSHTHINAITINNNVFTSQYSLNLTLFFLFIHLDFAFSSYLPYYTAIYCCTNKCTCYLMPMFSQQRPKPTEQRWELTYDSDVVTTH